MPIRCIVWLTVILIHVALIAAILFSHPENPRERATNISLTLLQLPRDPRSVGSLKFNVRMDPRAANFNINAHLPKALHPIIDNAISILPAEQQQPIDWVSESALAVQSSISRAADEKNYRDLSSLTPAQLDWIKKNHLEPAPGFQWDRNSRGEMLRHGIVKIDDYCVLILVIPYCRFGAKIQYNGDLFKDMRSSGDQ